MSRSESKITIDWGCRPCYVNGKKALFHRWADHAEPLSPSLMKGGQPGGQYWSVKAIVELEGGAVEMISPYEIRFIDTMAIMDEIAWTSIGQTMREA